MKSALMVFGSALMYAGMYKGTYGLPIFDAEGELHTAARLTYTLLETHGWLPSFLAGLMVRRRGALVGALTVVAGAAISPLFHDLWMPRAVIDDWDPAVVNLAQALFAVAGGAVAGIAGQAISNERSLNKPLQPIAREDARSS